MKQKIETKIEEIIDYIVSKPVAEVTIDDYTILFYELKELNFIEEQAKSGNRLAELMGMVASHTPPIHGSIN